MSSETDDETDDEADDKADDEKPDTADMTDLESEESAKERRN